MNKYIQLTFPQGDSKSYLFTVKSGSDTPINLTGATVRSDMRLDYSSEVVASFTPTYTDLPNGQFEIALTAEQSANLPVKGAMTRFVFDVEITFQDGTVQKAVYGHIVVTREVTR
jgi:hypothetical protein